MIALVVLLVLLFVAVMYTIHLRRERDRAVQTMETQMVAHDIATSELEEDIANLQEAAALQTHTHHQEFGIFKSIIGIFGGTSYDADANNMIPISFIHDSRLSDAVVGKHTIEFTLYGTTYTKDVDFTTTGEFVDAAGTRQFIGEINITADNEMTNSTVADLATQGVQVRLYAYHGIPL